MHINKLMTIAFIIKRMLKTDDKKDKTNYL